MDKREARSRVNRRQFVKGSAAATATVFGMPWQALAQGVARLAAAVEPTLGPKGMNAMIDLCFIFFTHPLSGDPLRPLEPAPEFFLCRPGRLVFPSRLMNLPPVSTG